MWLRSSGSWLLALALAGLVAGSGAAEEPEPQPEAAAPSVGLDALLRLPSGTGHAPEAEPRRADRERWEARFGALRAELADAEGKLAEAQAELEEIARGADAWQMAAPGAKHDPETSPISYKLRSDIRRYREEISVAERRLRELEVEASLAGVPAEWRRPPQQDAVPESGATAGRSRSEP